MNAIEIRNLSKSFRGIMVSMMTPLGSTLMNVVLCLGGVLFALGSGAIGCAVLKRTSLV